MEAVEEIRRRAKDNKAKNAQFFIQLGLKALNDLRNLLFLVTFAFVGYLGAYKQQIDGGQTILIIISLLFGLSSYALLYVFSIRKATLYSDLEKNLSSKVFPTVEEYTDMIGEEETIYGRYKKIGLFHLFELLTIILQASILFYFVYTVLIQR